MNQIPEAARDKKNYCGQKCSVLFAQHCCRGLIVGRVFCRLEILLVECFPTECFFGARWAPRNSLMSMNGGLETVMITEDRFRIYKLMLQNKFRAVVAACTNFERGFLCIQLVYIAPFARKPRPLIISFHSSSLFVYPSLFFL